MKFKQYTTAMNVNVFQAEYKGLALELSLDKDHLQIVDPTTSECESYNVNAGVCEYASGDLGLLLHFTDEEWATIESAIESAK